MSLTDLQLKGLLSEHLQIERKGLKKESWSIRKEERTTERAEIWVYIIDYPFLHELYKSHLITKTEIFTPSSS